MIQICPKSAKYLTLCRLRNSQRAVMYVIDQSSSKKGWWLRPADLKSACIHGSTAWPFSCQNYLPQNRSTIMFSNDSKLVKICWMLAAFWTISGFWWLLNHVIWQNQEWRTRAYIVHPHLMRDMRRRRRKSVVPIKEKNNLILSVVWSE